MGVRVLPQVRRRHRQRQEGPDCESHCSPVSVLAVKEFFLPLEANPCGYFSDHCFYHYVRAMPQKLQRGVLGGQFTIF